MASKQRGGNGHDRAPVFRFEPRTAAQRRARELWRDCDVLFLVGPAGGGKTHAALGLAIGHALERKEPVIVCRPAVECSATLGYTKGDLSRKLAPWMAPFHDCMARLILNPPPGLLEPTPLGVIRGRTFSGVAILDEAQNCTAGEILTFLTRLGQGGKLLVTGDPMQSDIGARSGLMPWLKALQGLQGVGLVPFPPGESMRHPLVARMIERAPKGR